MTSDNVVRSRLGARQETALWLAIAGILAAAIGFSRNPTPLAQALAAIFIACALVLAAFAYGAQAGYSLLTHAPLPRRRPKFDGDTWSPAKCFCNGAIVAYLARDELLLRSCVGPVIHGRLLRAKQQTTFTPQRLRDDALDLKYPSFASSAEGSSADR